MSKTHYRPREIQRIWGMTRHQWKHLMENTDLQPKRLYPGAKPYYPVEVVRQVLGPEPKTT